MDMTEAILISAGTIGPLAIASTIFSKRHSYERWARIALIICAFDAVAWGVSGFLDALISPRNHWHFYISRFHGVFTGIGMGLFLLLLLTGQLKTPPRKELP
jgi:hypothetical protein